MATEKKTDYGVSEKTDMHTAVLPNGKETIIDVVSWFKCRGVDYIAAWSPITKYVEPLPYRYKKVKDKLHLTQLTDKAEMVRVGLRLERILNGDMPELLLIEGGKR